MPRHLRTLRPRRCPANGGCAGQPLRPARKSKNLRYEDCMLWQACGQEEMEKTESRIQEEQGKSKKGQGIREAKSVLISNIEQGMSNVEGEKPFESVKSVAPCN